MVKYYKKRKKIGKKKLVRILSLALLLSGVLLTAYIFFPLLSWQIYFAPAFANQEINSPIPKNTIVSGNTIASLLAEASQSLSGVDFNNAQNWFPSYRYQQTNAPLTENYSITIPSIKLKDAQVSTIDTDLTKHLVNYVGTAVPPDRGNAVIFGHSTLPQLYNESNYKTIFTNVYKMIVGDNILVKVGNSTYTYKVETITVVDPSNTSVLEQNYDGSFLTLVTCTPPGTIWKRLIVKARMQPI